MSRALSMTFQTLVTIIIAVVLLVSVILFYTGQSSVLFGDIGDLGGSASEGIDSASESADVLLCDTDLWCRAVDKTCDPLLIPACCDAAEYTTIESCRIALTGSDVCRCKT